MHSPSVAGRHPSHGFRGTLCVAVLAIASTACQDNAVTAPTASALSARVPARASVVAAVKTDTLAAGDSVQLTTPPATKRANGPATWTTSDAHIATVTPDGLVRGVAPGTAKVRVSRRGTVMDSVAVVVASRVAPTPPPVPPAPAPAPVPSVTPPTGTPAAVLAFMGATNVPTVAAMQARGGVYAKYEADFASYANYQWTADSTSQGANYYDRAMIYYVSWARTGNATYLNRANKLAVAARHYLSGVADPGYNTLISTPYTPQTYQMMVDGVALHALVTGDQESANTVARVADVMGNPNGYYSYVAGNPGDGDGDSRNSARVLGAVLDAYLLKVASPAGYNYGALLPNLMSRILGTQGADGAYRWPNQCNYTKPFMTGMVNESLIRYHTSFQADARIPVAVKRAVDYTWATDWMPDAAAFKYLDADCANPNSGGTAGPAAALPHFAWIMRRGARGGGAGRSWPGRTSGA